MLAKLMITVFVDCGIASRIAMTSSSVYEPTKKVIATVSFTGLRMSELRGLRWGDSRDGQVFVTGRDDAQR
jgi:integrase